MIIFKNYQQSLVFNFRCSLLCREIDNTTRKEFKSLLSYVRSWNRHMLLSAEEPVIAGTAPLIIRASQKQVISR